MEYTKGDWLARKQEENNPDSWEYDVVCQVEAGMYPSTVARDVNVTNAQLIASAPRMYEALKLLRGYSEMVDNALAKAEGK